MSRKWFNIILSSFIVFCLFGLALNYPELRSGVELVFVLPIVFFTLYDGWRLGLFVATISSLFSFWGIGVGNGAVMRIIVYFSMVLLLGIFRNRRDPFLAAEDSVADIRGILYVVELISRNVAKALSENKSLSIAVVGLRYFDKLSSVLSVSKLELLVRSFSRIFLRHLPSSSIMVRYSENRFVIICPDMGATDVENLLNRVREKLKLHSGILREINISEGVDLLDIGAGIVEYDPDVFADIKSFFVTAEDAFERVLEVRDSVDSYEVIKKQDMLQIKSRRYWRRIQLDDKLDVIFYDESGVGHKVVPQNICLSGIMFFSSVPVEENKVYDLELVFADGERLIVDARTVWAKKIENEGYQVGVFLSQLSSYQKAILDRELKLLFSENKG